MAQHFRSHNLIAFGQAQAKERIGDLIGEVLTDLLGFEYEQFVESFYLAQREITTPHPHSQAVKIMAGVAPFEKVGYSLRDEIEEREELLGEIQAEWDAVHQDVLALGIQDGQMQRLEDERYHPKNWRPAILAFSGGVSTRIRTSPSAAGTHCALSW